MNAHSNSLPTAAQTFTHKALWTTLKIVDLPFTPALDDRINSGLDTSQLLIAGELHGIRENADVLYTLARRYDINTLGFEAWPTIRPMVEEFLLTGRCNVDVLASRRDGSMSAEYLALMRPGLPKDGSKS